MFVTFKCCSHDNAFLFDLKKIIEYCASAVKVVSSNPCVRPSLRIKIPFPALSVCTDELTSTPKVMIFLPTLPSGIESS